MDKRVINLSVILWVIFVDKSRGDLENMQKSSHYDSPMLDELLRARLSSKPDYFIAAEPLFRKSRMEGSRGPVSKYCLLDLLAYKAALTKNWQFKAQSMFDAQGSFKIKSGDYTKCGHEVILGMEYYGDLSSTPRVGFSTKFCTASFKNVDLIGICVPVSCATSDLNNLFAKGFPASYNKGKLLCGSNLILKKDFSFYAARNFLCFIVLLSCVATLLTHFYRGQTPVCMTSFLGHSRWLSRRLLSWLCTSCVYFSLRHRSKDATAESGRTKPEKEPTVFYMEESFIEKQTKTSNSESTKCSESAQQGLLHCFCLRCNMTSLASQEMPGSDFLFIPAIRVLSMSLVVFYHTYYYVPVYRLVNPQIWLKFKQSFTGKLVTKTNVSVEAFFVISAMLATIQCASKSKSKVTNISSALKFVFKCYIKRLWRLAPVYYITVLIQTYVIPYWQMNPSKGQDQLATCQNAMLSHLTFTYNLNIAWHGLKEINCIPQAWYVSADLQMYLFVPWLALFYNRYRTKTLVFACFLPFFVSMATTWLAQYKTQNIWNGTWMIYSLPQHVNSYVLGLLLGLLYLTTKFDVTLNKVVKFMVVLFFLCCAYIVHVENGLQVESITNWPDIVFYSNWRSCYAVLICCLILYCSFYKTSVISDFLSSPCWLPLSRLSYCVYLISGVMQRYHTETTSYPIMWTGPSEIVFHACGYVLLSILFSILIWLTVEKPCYNLAKNISNLKSL